MSLARFQFTDRVRPIVEIGVGDTRIASPGGQWDQAHWDTGDVWSGVDPTWLDITCDCFSYACEYGRARTIDRFVAGTATVVVHNATGWADPHATETPGQLTMRPGRAIRMGVIHDTYGTRWLFHGFLDAMNPTYDPVEMDTVEFACIDALGEINRAQLPALADPAYGGDTIDTRIGRILDAAKWPTTKRDLAPASDTVIAHNLGGQVADLLGQVADSGGGSVYGDLEGNIAFRGRDWQMYAPGTPPDGTIGNVGEDSNDVTWGLTGSDIVWHGDQVVWFSTSGTPQVDGYLTPTVGTVTTPDPGVLPAECCFVFTAQLPVDLTTHDVLVSQDAPGQRSWSLFRWYAATTWVWSQSADGTNEDIQAAAGSLLSPGDQTWALAVDQASSVADRAFQAFRYDGTAWIPDPVYHAPALAVFDSTAPVRIGANYGGSANIWHGRIYSVELRTGLDPAAGTVVWRFDANDYPGTGTSYVDPRGRTWTLSAAGAITPKVPAVPPVPADVCPTQWERPFTRADMTTRVLIGRDTDTAQLLDDIPAQEMYGIEPFTRTDLLTESDDDITRLGERILRTRAAATTPRIRSVSLDAATADNVIDLMTTVDVYKPSRYRCRLRYPRGDVFDAEHFATAVSHSVTPASWSLLLNLDLAAPWAAAGGHWDDSNWDAATWSNGTDLVARLTDLLQALEGVT